jgi:hypothetical protein
MVSGQPSARVVVLETKSRNMGLVGIAIFCRHRPINQAEMINIEHRILADRPFSLCLVLRAVGVLTLCLAQLHRQIVTMAASLNKKITCHLCRQVTGAL